MELEVLNIQGKGTGKKITLSDDVFGIEPNEHAVYLDVKQYLANQRQGTHKSKERNEVTGSTRKIKRQKGTGTARAGSIKSPVFVGGGTIFGPRPRSYSFKLNKGVKRLARKSVLSDKAKSGDLMIVEDFSLAAPKTKEFVDIMNKLGLGDKKTVVVLGDSNKNVYLSSRNLKGKNVLTVSEISTYSLMNTSKIVLLESSVDVLTNNLTK